MTFHAPGWANFANAGGRPAQSPDPLESAEQQISSVAAAAIAVGPQDIAEASKGDPAYLAMLQFLTMPHAFDPAPCRPYHTFRDKMYVLDGRILYDDWMVILLLLHPCVLRILHSAHQGVFSMTHRAAQTGPGRASRPTLPGPARNAPPET